MLRAFAPLASLLCVALLSACGSAGGGKATSGSSVQAVSVCPTLDGRYIKGADGHTEEVVLKTRIANGQTEYNFSDDEGTFFIADGIPRNFTHMENVSIVTVTCGNKAVSIDLQVVGGPHKGGTLHATYSMDGENLQIHSDQIDLQGLYTKK